MLRIPLLILIALVVTFFGAVQASLWALDATRGFGGLSVNGWTAYPDIQTQDADPYAKAHRANNGRLLLGRAEGLVFRADADQGDQALSTECRYQVRGRVPPSLFWTLRATYPDKKSLELPIGWPSVVNAHKALKDKDGNISVTLSSSAETGNWLALAKNGPFELHLTLIDTPTSNDSGIREFEMPSVIQLECTS